MSKGTRLNKTFTSLALIFDSHSVSPSNSGLLGLHSLARNTTTNSRACTSVVNLRRDVAENAGLFTQDRRSSVVISPRLDKHETTRD